MASSARLDWLVMFCGVAVSSSMVVLTPSWAEARSALGTSAKAVCVRGLDELRRLPEPVTWEGIGEGGYHTEMNVQYTPNVGVHTSNADAKLQELVKCQEAGVVDKLATTVNALACGFGDACAAHGLLDDDDDDAPSSTSIRAAVSVQRHLYDSEPTALLYHRDNLSMRLVCVLQGAGTAVLSDDAYDEFTQPEPDFPFPVEDTVQRMHMEDAQLEERLTCPDFYEAHRDDPSSVSPYPVLPRAILPHAAYNFRRRRPKSTPEFVARAGDVLLLKGNLWYSDDPASTDAMRGQGVLHRAPARPPIGPRVIVQIELVRDGGV